MLLFKYLIINRFILCFDNIYIKRSSPSSSADAPEERVGSSRPGTSRLRDFHSIKFRPADIPSPDVCSADAPHTSSEGSQESETVPFALDVATVTDSPEEVVSVQTRYSGLRSCRLVSASGFTRSRRSLKSPSSEPLQSLCLHLQHQLARVAGLLRITGGAVVLLFVALCKRQKDPCPFGLVWGDILKCSVLLHIGGYIVFAKIFFCLIRF